VEFRITRHSGAGSPADALDSLCLRLGAKRDGVSFAKVGGEIRVKAPEDASASMTWDERAEIRRRVVVDIVRGVCEPAAELEWKWFAVSSGR
jgi:hypothetical protein